MRFTLKVVRDVVGNKIDLKILRSGSQLIARIDTELDTFKLGSDQLSEPSVHFERHFRQAGEAGPGTEHTLIVKATDTDGSSEVATKIWLDET